MQEYRPRPRGTGFGGLDEIGAALFRGLESGPDLIPTANHHKLTFLHYFATWPEFHSANLRITRIYAPPFELAVGFWLSANIRIENHEDQVAIAVNHPLALAGVCNALAI